MRKGIFAMEEMNVAPVADEVELDSDARVISENETDIEEDREQLDEAKSIVATVDELSKPVEQAIASGEGITEVTADVLNTAVEHFCVRLGYKKKVVPAMEGFAAETRLQKSKVALENMQQLSARVGAQIAISQEGLFARAKNVIERIFTSEEKIVGSLTELASATAKEVTDIKDPAWGRVFARNGKTEIASADVVAYLSTLDKAISAKSIDLMDKATSLISKGTALLKKSDFQVADGVLAEFEKLAAESSKLSESLDKIVGDQGKETAVNMTSAAANDFKKISELALRLISNKPFFASYDKMDLAFAEAYEEIDRSAKVRVVSRATANDQDGQQQAADVRAFVEILKKSLDTVFDVLGDVVGCSYKASYSSYKYLAASAAK